MLCRIPGQGEGTNLPLATPISDARQSCLTLLPQDCNLSGPEVCRTEYISECWTKNDPHLVEDDVAHCQTVQEEKCVETVSGYSTQEDCKKWPREVCTISRETKAKFNPVTKCEKVPQQLCGPSGCGFVQGPEICHDEVDQCKPIPLHRAIQVCADQSSMESILNLRGIECTSMCFQVKTVVTDIPEEVCDLQPQRSCKPTSTSK